MNDGRHRQSTGPDGVIEDGVFVGENPLHVMTQNQARRSPFLPGPQKVGNTRVLTKVWKEWIAFGNVTFVECENDDGEPVKSRPGVKLYKYFLGKLLQKASLFYK